MNTMLLRGEIVAKYKTQQAFASKIGWHPNKVSSVLNNKYKLNTDDISLFVTALEMDKEMFSQIFLPNISPSGDIHVIQKGR